MKTSDEDIRKIEDLEDGSSIYEIGSILEEEEPANTNFNENIAAKFPEAARKKLSAFLLEGIEQDIVVRQKWLQPIQTAKPYLGFDLEDAKLKNFKEGTRTFDTTFATALIRFYATTKPELYPASGPAGFKINGEVDDETERKAELNIDYLNYYLTTKDTPYYRDCERFLLNLGFCGTIFKKVYFDKLLKRPLSRFIMPENFVIDADCTSIIESSRLTHILHLSKREIIFSQQNKIYLDVELPYLKSSEIDDDEGSSLSTKNEKVDLSEYKKRSLFPIYEVHTYLTLDDFTDENNGDQSDSIDKASKEILSIVRNWDEEDEEKKQREYFVQYNYLPGFGIYGFGLAHLIGTNAISLTAIQRMLIDAGKFKNMPGGFRQKGLKQQDTTIIVGPGEWPEVDTGGKPLSEMLFPLPYSEPSNALRELRLETIEQCKELASTSEMGMLNSKEDIPVGTTLALLETNNKIQSAVSSSIHHSFSKELQLLNKLFKKTIENEEFNFGKAKKVITSDDFLDEVTIVPVSDPSTNSSMQRIIKADSLLRTAMQAPELHDMREVFKRNYEAQGLDNEEIDKLLPAPPEEQEILPLDPVSENLNIMKNEPVKAAIWQDHAAHKLIHGLFAQDYPDSAPATMAHIKEHEAFEYLVQMQQLLGMEMPPLEQIVDPEVQNAIAMAIAGSLDEAQEVQPSSPSQEDLILADIQQQQAEVEAKERIEDQRTETNVYKAMLDFEKEKAKIQSNEEIAQLKTEADILKAELAVEREKAKIDSNERLAQLKAETELIKNGGENEETYNY